jgi:hypothetical protein
LRATICGLGRSGDATAMAGTVARLDSNGGTRTGSYVLWFWLSKGTERAAQEVRIKAVSTDHPSA